MALDTNSLGTNIMFTRDHVHTRGQREDGAPGRTRPQVQCNDNVARRTMPGHNIGQAVWALVVILECLVAWAAPPAHHVVLRQGRRAHVSQKAVG